MPGPTVVDEEDTMPLVPARQEVGKNGKGDEGVKRSLVSNPPAIWAMSVKKTKVFEGVNRS